MMREELYDKTVKYILENQNKFYRLVFSYTKEKESALDIVQNAICKALEKYTDIRDENKMNSWFYKVLLNETYSYLKKHKREFAVSDEQIPEQVYMERAYDKDDELYDRMNLLSDDLKTVIILRFFEDMALSEISCITGVNLNTVKTRLYTALRKLKKFYREAESNE